MVLKKIISEQIDSMTKKEILKYKANDDFEGNGIPNDIKLSDGTKVEVGETNLDKVEGWDGKFPFKMKNDKQAAHFIAAPKFVSDGRRGYTRYVVPVLADAQEEYSRGI